MNLTLSLEDVRNVVQIIFQLTASYVAVVGLRSWIVQLRGKTEYEAAKNVIAGAYRIRDEILRCQHSFLDSNEWEERQPVIGETPEQKKAAESWFALNQRFRKVIDAINDWYPARIEAEILFGEEADQIMNELICCCDQLQEAIDIYHRARCQNQPFQNTETHFNIIYHLPHRGDNDFQKTLDASIEEIKIFFSQYVRAGTFTLNPLQWLQKPKKNLIRLQVEAESLSSSASQPNTAP